MKKIIQFAIAITFIGIIFTSCNEENIDPSENTTIPIIDSIVATKYEIAVGGLDPTIITAHATGGNLDYEWEVDLGDIIPENSEASKVSFAGSPCCLGEKEITCTVTNNKGSDSKIIIINIAE